MVVESQRPATYREVFGVAEFRGLYAAYLLSMVGDMLAKVAVTFVVFERTRSPLLSAATFALSYLPWGVGGPFLAALADRWPRRRVLIWCDAARAALVALLTIPHMPWQGMLLVLFAAALLTPPFEAARSALMPDVLRGDRFVVATSVLVVSTYVAGVAGFVAGGALVQTITARGALAADSVTFALSALLIWVYLTPRPADPRPPRRSLARETGDGLRLVFGHRVLRSYLLLVWSVSALVSASEGLAAAYAAHLGAGPAAIGLLLAALPFGMAFGGLVLTRAVAPVERIRLAIPLATLATVSLLPLLFDPPLPVVLALYVLSGIGLATAIPLNAMFVRAVAAPYRGRAFGVARSGLEVAQGLAVVAAGAAASRLPVPVVIAVFGGVAGTALVALLAVRWPSVAEQLAAEADPAGG
ncbi:MAG TPA: MFS transporter [Mycobacteriales bacterium]